jgi:4-hydroxybenzoate polyprenyltransferase
VTDQIVPDSEHRGLVARLPQLPRDLALLARFDRPIGWWLLFWPCVFGVWLAGAGAQPVMLGWLLLGAIAMRGAGCVYNDIVDRDLDAQVARTASRPLPSAMRARPCRSKTCVSSAMSSARSRPSMSSRSTTRS